MEWKKYSGGWLSEDGQFVTEQEAEELEARFIEDKDGDVETTDD